MDFGVTVWFSWKPIPNFGVEKFSIDIYDPSWIEEVIDSQLKKVKVTWHFIGRGDCWKVRIKLWTLEQQLTNMKTCYSVMER